MGGVQHIQPGQRLTEEWEVEYTKRQHGSPVVAAFVHWPHPTHYVCRGDGETVEEARLQLATMLARSIHEDPNPFGDLGNVAHIANVVRFLEALRDGGSDEEGDHHPASAYYLPDQLAPDVAAELPEGWEKVIGHVIDMISSWADYYPEEELPADVQDSMAGEAIDDEEDDPRMS